MGQIALKPDVWNITPGAIAPEWQWAWKGLVWAVLPGGGWTQDVISGNRGTLLANGSWNGRGRHGKALLSTAGSDTGGAYWPFTDRILTITNQYAIIVFCDPASGGVSDWSHLFSIPQRSIWDAPYGAIDLSRNSAATSAISNLAKSGGGSESVSSNTGFFQDTDDLTMYAFVRSGLAGTFYRNVQNWGGGNFSALTAVPDWTNRQSIVLLNHHALDTGEEVGGTVPLALLYNRSLTPRELKALYLDPYAMFQPPPMQKFFWIGKAAGGTLYTQSVSGGLTPAGALAKQPGKILSGGLTPSGAISKQAQIVRAGGLTPSATIVKLDSKSFSGALTPSGTATKQTQKSFTGGLTPSGVAAFIKQAVLSVGGSLTPSGLLTKLTSKTVSGGLTPAGALAGIKTVLLSIGGSLTPSGVLSRQTQKIFGGSLTPSGTLSKSVGKITSGALTPAGTLAAIKTALLSIGGGLTPTGTIIRQTQKIAGGGLVLTGTLNKEIRKVLTGGLTPSGVLVALRTVLLSVGGSLTPSGTLATQAGVVITRIIGAIRTIAYERFRALIQDSSPYRVVTSDAAVYEVTTSDEDVI